MAERFFGVETEYAVAGFDRHGRPLDRTAVVGALLQRARRSLRHLRDGSEQGMFLANGARFYIDCGWHPELTTPECTTPCEIVRYVLAGERILLDLAAGAATRGSRIRVFRNNVDYSGSRSTWGCHESYMHRVDPSALPAQIIPHLVSRLIYSGAGGFNNLSPGLEFTLSPRVPHMTTDVSGDSTYNRGIFHTKDEPLAATGAHRLHLLCGESLCSQTSAFLKVGTTALIVAMIEAGGAPGSAVALRAPLAAMHSFAADPSCTAVVEALDGRRLRALDLQRHYLEMAESRLDQPQMPPWAEACCRLWRNVLDRLEDGPLAVAAELDWAIKLRIYQEHARRRGLEWTQLTTDLLPECLDLRRELLEIDVRFGQLDAAGIFTQLDAAGALAHRVDGVGEIEPAVTEPPPVGRARVRGMYVEKLGRRRRENVICDWSGIWDRGKQRTVDLRDPHTSEADWGEWIATGLHLRLRHHLDRAASATGADSGDVLDERDDLAAIEALERRSIEDAEQRWGPQHPQTALACNQLSVTLRSLGRPAEAEPFSRRALAIDEAARGSGDAKIPHRLNNLAIVLVMQEQLPEARHLLARAWAINAGRHDLTSARVVWTRLLAGLLAGEAQFFFTSLMKTLLSLPELPVGDVTAHWNIAPVIEYVRSRLAATDVRLLQSLVELLNDRPRHRRPGLMPPWLGAATVPLDAPWPAV